MSNLTNEKDTAHYRKVSCAAVVFASSDCVIKTLEGDVRCFTGDAILTGVEGERWPISRARFDTMYEPDGDFAHGCDGLYRKTISTFIWAKQMNEPFTVRIVSGDILTGKPGDWLAQYQDGQQGIVADEIFRKTYQRI